MPAPKPAPVEAPSTETPAPAAPAAPAAPVSKPQPAKKPVFPTPQ